jgi:hypothetical protein
MSAVKKYAALHCRTNAGIHKGSFSHSEKPKPDHLPQTSHPTQHVMRFTDITALVFFIVAAVALPVDKPVANWTCSQAEDCCPHPGPACD